EAALDYAKTRQQFDRPIAGFQLTQHKLAEMVLDVNRSILVAVHLGRMKDAGTLRPEHVSFGKLSNVDAALRVAREARTVLGANGITLEYPVIRHMNNLESVLTYEGTHEVHTLVVGQALTGENAFHYTSGSRRSSRRDGTSSTSRRCCRTAHRTRSPCGRSSRTGE